MKKLLILTLLLLTATFSSALAEETKWISIAENAVLPDETALTSYSSSVTLGKQQYDLQHLLNTLLGEDYLPIERGEYDYADEYRSAGGEEPWEYRQVSVYDQDHSFRYMNPWVHGERGGEYEAPRMTAIPAENIDLCKSLLEEIVPDEWLTTIDDTRWIRDKWDYTDRWMTDDEYRAFCLEHKSQYFTFSHTTDSGLPIIADHVFVNIGMDGLSSLTINWREAAESAEMLVPMTLTEALKLADSTRSAHCTLISARLVYSNWVTGNDTHNLSWYLATDAGNYVVDCVLNQRVCDSYEY